MTQTTTHNDTAVFPLLADQAGYVACPWDLRENDAERAYWLDLFRRHWRTLLDSAKAEAADRGVDATNEIARADAQFATYLDEVTADAGAHGRLDVLSICQHREMALRAAGIADPYRLVKQEENERAFAFLPLLLKELDAASSSERDQLVIEGVFAGNIFDMGAEHTQKMFEQGVVDFASVRVKLKPRPWAYDALDQWSARITEKPYEAALLFVDNAGPDVVLGMIPFARYLLQQGTTVVLSANTEPSLNDVTHEELQGLIARIAEFDAVVRDALQSQQLRLVESGNWAPLIDLTRVSPELAQVVEELPIDLVVLEGMGRSMESNPHCKLTCDCLRLAMVKDMGVARSFEAEMFDLVMRYERGGV